MGRYGVFMVLLLAGCATYTGQPLRPVNAGNLIHQDSWGDLIVGAELPGSTSDVERYLGRDLLDEDVLPVAIYLQNRSSEADYTLKSSDIQFLLPDGTALVPASATEVYDRASFSQWPSVPLYLLAILPGVFSSLDISAANDDMFEDYSAKAFQDVSLPARDPATQRSVCFFRPPKKVRLGDTEYSNGRLVLHASVRTAGAASGETEKDLTIYFRK